MNLRWILIATGLLGCDQLGPRASDEAVDGATTTTTTTTTHVRPAGTTIPRIADNLELARQITVYDGLSDSALAMSGGVITRSAAKAGGAIVSCWNFGPAPMEGTIPVVAPVYVFVHAGTSAPIAHPNVIDAIPGEPRYSPIRRIFHVAVTPTYAGELMPSVDAITEAIELGLVSEPVPAGTWQNMPVVPTGTRLEVGGTALLAPATEVFGRGYRIELFPLGGARGVQPLRSNNRVPVGEESSLLSGVVAGTPPVLPATPDSVPVLQFGIPATPPTNAPNYTPLVTQLSVRLATGVAPASLTDDTQLFARNSSGTITGFYTDIVESYAPTTMVTNKQLQFVEGAP